MAALLELADRGIQAESFSMHGPLYKQLREGGLELLNTFGEEIMQKREDSMPSIGYDAVVIS